MSVGVSLLDDLQLQPDDDDVLGTETAPTTDRFPGTSAHLQAHVTELANEDASTCCDHIPDDEDEAVLIADTPLVHYLHQQRIHDVRTVAAAAACGQAEGVGHSHVHVHVHPGNADVPSSPTRDSPRQEPDPCAVAPLQPLGALCCVLCPAAILWAMPYPRIREPWPVQLTRAQWQTVSRGCASAPHPSERGPASRALPPPSHLFPVLRLAVVLHSVALLCLLLLCLGALPAFVLMARPLSISALLATAIIAPSVVAVALVNCAVALTQLRRSWHWHEAAGAVESIRVLSAQCSHSVRRAVQRVLEVEMVSRGYFLSPNTAAVISLDHKQSTQLRHSIALRRSTLGVLQQLVAAVRHAWLELQAAEQGVSRAGGPSELLSTVWAAANLSAPFTMRDSALATLSAPASSGSETPSIAELKALQSQLKQTQSRLWAQVAMQRSSATDAGRLCAALHHLHSALLDARLRLSAALLPHSAALSHSALLPSLFSPSAPLPASITGCVRQRRGSSSPHSVRRSRRRLMRRWTRRRRRRPHSSSVIFDTSSKR